MHRVTDLGAPVLIDRIIQLAQSVAMLREREAVPSWAVERTNTNKAVEAVLAALCRAFLECAKGQSPAAG